MIHRYYSADVAKALGTYDDPELSPQVAEALQSGENRLGKIVSAMPTESIKLQNFGAAAQSASDATEVTETSLQQLTDTELDEVLGATDPPLTAHEVQGMFKAVKTECGKLTNYLSTISERDEHLKRERLKLDLAKKGGLDEDLKRGIKDRIHKLEQERAALLEDASASVKELRSQINRIQETMRCILNEDGTLVERIRTLFHEHGINIASILTAIGLAISTLVLALTGGSGSASQMPPSDKGGLKDWLKKHLESLGWALVKLARKAAAALPGIIGSIVSCAPGNPQKSCQLGG